MSGLDKIAIDNFVSSAKMGDTSFSRAGVLDATGARIAGAEEEFDNRVGKVDKYLSKYKHHTSNH